MKEEIAELLAPYQREKGALIPALQKIQEKYGYLPPDAIKEAAQLLNVSVNELYGVATFYAQFRFTRPGRHSIKVCLGTACHVRGGARIMDRVQDELGIRAGEVTEDYRFGMERVACFGCCALAPVVVVDQDIHSKMTPVKTLEVLKRYE
ncbi:MAG: NADH-quinone oxidoreductase subunit NuoE [Chloroflexi bacterium]|nr:NADH-quinone oxidoreductase subunit NuoE [Chloroflexota bacterium]